MLRSILFVVLVFKGCLSVVYLYGPKYVETRERINLTCSSDETPTGFLADFIINRKSYTSLLKTEEDCINTKLRLRCDSGSCGCSEDGRTFFLLIDAVSLKGVNVVVCSMRFNSMEIVASLNLTVYDVVGPKITTDQEFPFKAGTHVELTCNLEVDIEDFEFTLNCLNLSSVSEKQENSQMYFTRVKIKADKQHRGKVCSCSFKKDNSLKTDYIVLDIISYPVVEIQNNQRCTGSVNVQIICYGIGELGFIYSDWEHFWNGTFIRKLKGESEDNMFVLTIAVCTYKDAGEYMCSAYKTFQNRTFWSNKTTSIVFQGPPILISADTYIISATTFSVQYLSMSKPKVEQWFIYDELILSSLGFISTAAKNQLCLEIYGKRLATEGYSTNLSITNNKTAVYTVLLQNEFGITKHQFFLKQAGSKFSMNSIIWVLAVGIVFITTVVATVFCMNRRYRQYFLSRTQHGTHVGPIYYAAPPPEQADSSHTYDSTSPRYETTLPDEHRRQYDVTEPYLAENDERKEDTEEEDIIHDYIEII